MKKDITFVTAFFDIGRKNFNGFSRDNQKYIDSFEFWARIKNKIVVYSDKETLKKVREIRGRFGLLDKTVCVEVKDFMDINPELYNRIEHVMKNPQYLDFHVQRNIPEAISPKYNYIMALKSWCCKDAIKNKFAEGIVAWIDFGFNHNGEFYKNSNEFDFEWKYDFSDKIHLMVKNEFDDNSIFEIVKRNYTYVQGSVLIAPDHLWDEFDRLINESINSLLDVDLMDDDQILYLMSYRKNPELFELHNCNWHEVFNVLGNYNLEYSVPKISKLRMFVRKCKHPTESYTIRYLKYAKLTYKNLKKSQFKG